VITAAILAGFSAALGGAIALVARRHPAVLERTRTFAFAAAAGVVAFHLLPEVLAGQGLAALLWMAVGFALPWALEAAARAFGPGLLHGRGLPGLRVSAEVGFAALIFHSVVEGLALVAALARPSGKLDLEIALVAHHAPLTAAVVLPFLELRGPRMVAVRAALVAAAGIGGALASGALPGFSEGALLQKATAVTAGALLHVVSDEIRQQRFGSRWERAADLGACLAGLMVAGLGALLHLRQESRAGPALEFLRTLGGLSLAVAPALLAGSVACALLGARARLFRVDALLLALALLGPVPAIVYAVSNVLLALPKRATSVPDSRPVAAELLSVVRERAPRFFTLLVAAAGLDVSCGPFPAHGFSSIALIAAIAVAARLDEAGGVLFAAILVAKGLHPGIGVAMVVLVSAARALRTPARLQAALLALVALGTIAALSAAGTLRPSGSGVLAHLREPIAAQAAGTPLGLAAGTVLLALALVTLWGAGVRGWFSPLRHGAQSAA